MEFQTLYKWNESIWIEAEKIYEQAFPEHSRKKRSIIQKMFYMNMCYLHLGYIENELVAMALSGKVADPDVLILDYLAVKKGFQNHGIGKMMVEYIKEWCQESGKQSLVIVEVEAEKSKINEKRCQFWIKCSFQLTDYAHSYIWVPEKYRAMFYSLKPLLHVPNGKELFNHITEFHKKGYSRT